MRTTQCWFVVTGLVVAACQDGAPMSGSSRNEGLTIFNQSRDQGLVGMYAERDRAVFFETVTQPMTQDVINHYYEHEIPLTRPNFVVRWSDEEGRAIAGDGDEWADEPAEYASPERWEVTLDLARKASGLLADASLDPEVADEQARLVTYANTVPDAAARTWQPSEDELRQISDRQIAYGYLGYSWRSYYYVRKPSGVDFHQGSSWNNHRYYSGAWHYYNNIVQNNGVYSPDYECSGVYSNVQDYKTYGSSDTTIALGNYARCGGTYSLCSFWWEQRFNCRSEALRQQVWVVGNTRCSAWSGMCDVSQSGVGGGAFCGMRTSCSSRLGC
jgi:hypothetical protein